MERMPLGLTNGSTLELPRTQLNFVGLSGLGSPLDESFETLADPGPSLVFWELAFSRLVEDPPDSLLVFLSDKLSTSSATWKPNRSTKFLADTQNDSNCSLAMGT